MQIVYLGSMQFGSSFYGLYFYKVPHHYIIYIRTVSLYRLLNTLLKWFELVYGPFSQSNICTLHFYPQQPRRNQMYQSLSRAQPDWTYQFPDQTGPARPDWIRTYIF